MFMADGGSAFFNPYEEIRQSANRLPHWEQAGAPCFITFRLADSLPESLLEEWHHERAIWLCLHPEPWDEKTNLEYQKYFRTQIEGWLDAGYGSCLLRERSIAEIVGHSLQCFHGERYQQIAWVVMPNHVHLLCAFHHTDWPMSKMVQGWKSFSSRQIKRQLEGRTPEFIWQKDYHDRLIRNADHFRRVVRYIRANPLRARLPTKSYLHWESDLASKVA
jgi:REP element-mobilizing transposase RayT